MHKSGTWDGPGRAWNWSPGYRKETELQGVLALSRRGGAGRVLAEALGALAFPQSSHLFLDPPYHSHPPSPNLLHGQSTTGGHRKAASALAPQPRPHGPPRPRALDSAGGLEDTGAVLSLQLRKRDPRDRR